MRGQSGPIMRVVGPADGMGLRQQLARQARPSAVVELISQASDAGYAEFAKAMQRCGELRDHIALLSVWRLARERDIKLSLQAYGILMTAAARTARGLDGRGLPHEDKATILKAGKVAWEWMKYEDHQPNLQTYGAALGLCAKAGGPQWARELWSEMTLANGILPTAVELTQYLEAVVAHEGASGWETVASEVGAARGRGHGVSEVTLSALLNAAAEQHQLEWADWLWKGLAHQVRLNALVYCARSKALLLCGQPGRVPLLRGEMSERGIEPCFRTFSHEVQAQLLLLRESPTSSQLHGALNEAVSLGHALLQRRDALGANLRTARSEVLQLRHMRRASDRIIQGESLALQEVQVIDWPWRVQ